MLGSPGVKFICTVHDSIVWDVVPEKVDWVVETIFKCWDEIPTAYEQMFKQKMDLPPKVEVGVGPNWKDLEERKYEQSEQS